MSGDEVSFKCPYRNADPPASVTWQKNGKILNSAGEKRYKAEAKYFNISDVVATDTGNYTCTASNAIGGPVVARFFLKVIGKIALYKIIDEKCDHALWDIIYKSWTWVWQVFFLDQSRRRVVL